ncbi:hypothetical protein [Methylobacterium haplocladii]|uniref:Uncharacterized protein n=1 Tax=Methylobacterium haplocladii TaxID=1176176 RepID=A0A512IVV4_9HYPH|nr:hypothetical protein [Methylobacterium haplocladii]GEP01729.1 hypothetical protein MHA02_41160 [Methylobacterium haplocladii]GLS59395.1 hypothetical protein GCM10007887_20610 [Methylobacterium haplocladii]
MQVETTIAADTPPFPKPGRHPGFSSFKTIRPILYPARWHRDLLIQATLDPAIEAIGQVFGAEAGRDELNLDLILGGTRVLVAAMHDGDGRLLQERRPGAVVLAKSTVLAEPRAADARAVWATRGLAVQPGDRLRILIASEDGGSHPIRELAACVRHPDADPFETVLSLVCRGDLLIDMKDGLQPEAGIRRRVSARDTVELFPDRRL